MFTYYANDFPVDTSGSAAIDYSGFPYNQVVADNAAAGYWDFDGDLDNTGSMQPTALNPKFQVFNYTNADNAIKSSGGAYGATANHARVDLSDASFHGGDTTFTIATTVSCPATNVGSTGTTVFVYGDATNNVTVFNGSSGDFKLRPKAGGVSTQMESWPQDKLYIGDGQSHALVVTRVENHTNGSLPASTPGKWYFAAGSTANTGTGSVPAQVIGSNVSVSTGEIAWTNSATDYTTASNTHDRVEIPLTDGSGTSTNLFSVNFDFRIASASLDANSTHLFTIGPATTADMVANRKNRMSVYLTPSATDMYLQTQDSGATNDRRLKVDMPALSLDTWHSMTITRLPYPKFGTTTPSSVQSIQSVAIFVDGVQYALVNVDDASHGGFHATAEYGSVLTFGPVGISNLAYSPKQKLKIKEVQFWNGYFYNNNTVYQVYLDGIQKEMHPLWPHMANPTISAKTLYLGNSPDTVTAIASASNVKWEYVWFYNTAVTPNDIGATSGIVSSSARLPVIRQVWGLQPNTMFSATRGSDVITNTGSYWASLADTQGATRFSVDTWSTGANGILTGAVVRVKALGAGDLFGNTGDWFMNIDASKIPQSINYSAGTSQAFVHPRSNWIAHPPKFECKLVARFFYLDDFERKQFALNGHEYLITETQFFQQHVGGESEVDLELRFNHPVKELLFWYKPSDLSFVANKFRSDPDFGYNAYWKFYNDNSEFGDGHLFSRANLYMNSQSLYGDGRDPIYFSFLVPADFHTRVEKNSRVYCIPFCLRPESWKPSGSVNMSRLDSVKLALKGIGSSSKGGIPPGTIDVYARSFNLVRIQSGMGGKRFAS
eukprot:jgi/Mesvir1/18128/Mv09426-RA.1